MTRRSWSAEHVFQRRDLEIRAFAAAVGDERQVEIRKFVDQAAHDGNRRVVRVEHAEHDLESRIVLLAEGAQVFVELGLGTAQRLEHGDRGGDVNRVRGSCGEASHRNDGAHEIRDAEPAQAQENHRSAPQ